jgi:alkylated DNA repair dioxygenase AlkB
MSGSKVPIYYEAGFVSNDLFERLWTGLEWERRPDAPRRECWMNDFGAAYTYGRGAGVRTYEARSWNPLVLEVRDRLATMTGTAFEGCFVNGYEGPRDHLGWHADDSPEIDGNRPIGVVSLGSARNIMFREKGSSETESVLLEPGSLLLMKAGMQATHEHRIPKHAANCGARISLTFRGLVR